MDETTFRILDILSRDLDSPISINEITNRIKELYGTSYYKNIYDKIQGLRKQNILTIFDIGNSSIIKLNFNNYLLTDILAEMELKKKQNFLGKRSGLQTIFLDMEKSFNSGGFAHIESISSINPERNMKLNRMELLFIMSEPLQWTKNGLPEPEEKRRTIIQNEIIGIHSIMQTIQKIHSIKIDYLILKENELFESLKSENINPLKAMLSDKIVIYSPQSFWITIKIALIKGIQTRAERKEINPMKISEGDLVYNSNRFGYKEIGPKIKQGKNFCIEYIITSILLKNDARRIEAIPILLSKNKINYNLLLFLCQKYDRLDKLFGLLTIMNKIEKNVKIKNEIENQIKILSYTGIRKSEFNEKSIMKKMRLYNAA